jgi:SAM-dependent methyltransferase
MIQKAVRLLEEGRFRQACSVQMETESLNFGNPFRFLRKGACRGIPLAPSMLLAYRLGMGNRVQGALSFGESLRRFNSGTFGTYLALRFASPSFQEALPWLGLMGEVEHDWILDLGSGAGHLARVMNALYPASRIVCVDQHFICLYLSKRFVSPHSLHVCAELANLIPFDKTFQVVFCSDMLHTQKRRQRLIQGAMKMLAEGGIFMAPRMDSAWGGDHVLSLRQWQKLFAPYHPRFFSDDDLRRQYAEKDWVDFAAAQITSEKDALSLSVAATFSARFNPPVVRGLVDKLKDALPFSLHPLYEYTHPSGGNLHFRKPAQFPGWCRDEDMENARKYLPDRLVVPGSLMRGRVIDPAYEGLARWIRTGVAVPFCA